MARTRRSGIDFTVPLFPEDRVKAEKARQFGTPEFKKAYLDHLRSPYWRALSRKVRSNARGKCSRCKLPAKRLDVHHIHYDSFGRESEHDVEALCVACHHRADNERIRRGIQNFFAAGEEARREAAKDTYLSKRLSSYGDDYMLAYYCDSESYDSEFDEWYDRKRDEEYYE